MNGYLKNIIYTNPKAVKRLKAGREASALLMIHETMDEHRVHLYIE
jgi:hypothetical protein